MKLFVTLVGLCLAFNLHAQVSGSNTIDSITRAKQKIYFGSQHSPVYKGGQDAWNRDVYMALGTDSVALAKDGSASVGTCELQFTVWYDGSVGNIQAITNTNSRLATDLIQFVRGTSGWTPAQVNGQIVNCMFRVKVHYPQ